MLAVHRIVGQQVVVEEVVAEGDRDQREDGPVDGKPQRDQTKILKSRMELLLRNAGTGLLLVFIVLALFLRLRLAFWVAIGVPIAFLGTLSVFVPLGISIDVISLFAFILVLGILVGLGFYLPFDIVLTYTIGTILRLASELWDPLE